jgi:pilus assembly protein CpaD
MSARLSITLTLAATIVSACATQTAPEGAHTPTTADMHRIAVTETAARLELPVGADDTTLNVDDEMALKSFASRYLQQGHGAMVVSLPAGAANVDAAGRVSGHVRMRLSEVGVPYSAIANASYDASARPDAPIVLSFLVYRAEAPTCEPLWSQDLAHNPSNQAWRSFGCSMQANLAAMLADPADLLGPREEDPRDAARRANVLEAYRKGTKTHADRSDEERVQVSKAVQ